MLFQQFWQCSGMPPIAGLALSRDAYKALTGEPDWEPGRPFAWSMVVRTDSNGPTQGCHTSDEHAWSPFAGLLMPDVWHTFVLRIQIRPEGGGSVKMWQDGNPLSTFPTEDCQHTTTWYPHRLRRWRLLRSACSRQDWHRPAC